MCLAVPGQVQEIFEANGVCMGKVNFGGIVKEVCLAYVPDIQVGEYTIVHVGFALHRIDEASAKETLADFERMGILEEELGLGESPAIKCAFPEAAASEPPEAPGSPAKTP